MTPMSQRGYENRPPNPLARSRLPWALGFVALALLVAAGAYALRTGTLKKTVESSSAWVTAHLSDDGEPNGPTYISRDFNYRFVLPGASWHKDDALKVAVKANSLA